MAKPFVRLRAKFLEEDVDQKSLARLINIDPSTLSKKLMGYSPFTSDESIRYVIFYIFPMKNYIFSFRDGRGRLRTGEKVLEINPHL